jgi:hypothetical protein
MGEDVRLVKMKNVNDVGVASGSRKTMSSSSSQRAPAAMIVFFGAPLPNRRGQLRFHSVPAVGIAHLRLVQNFEEHSVRIPRRIALRHLRQKSAKRSTNSSSFAKRALKSESGCMSSLNRETRIENHFDRGVEIAEIFVAAARATAASMMGCGFTLSRT